MPGWKGEELVAGVRRATITPVRANPRLQSDGAHPTPLPGKHQQTQLWGTWMFATTNTAKVSKCPTAIALCTDWAQSLKVYSLTSGNAKPTTARRKYVPHVSHAPHPPENEVQEESPGASLLLLEPWAMGRRNLTGCPPQFRHTFQVRERREGKEDDPRWSPHEPASELLSGSGQRDSVRAGAV